MKFRLPKTAMRLPLLALTLLLPLSLHAAGELNLAPVKKWISQQGDFRAVSADFVQTRALKSLRDPLKSPGHIWFVAPDSFRWELGSPVKTIVLRKGNDTYVITPAKKRAERHPANGRQDGIQSMATMSFVFAKDFAEYQRKFETLAISVEGTRCHLEIAPRDPQTRKFLSAIKVDFNTTNGEMRAFEVVTRDGSSMRNEFSDVQVNPKIDRRVFDFDFSGYEIIDAK